MSFPRAKIQRFNEITACTPSPADYNVAVKSKPVLAIIPQTERFAVPQSPAVSESGSQMSHCSTPNSKNIALPKKKKPQSAQKPQTKSKDIFPDLEPAHIEVLKEKLVEINNKDTFIRELTENVEEFKQKISDLNNQLINEKKSYEEKLETVNENYEVTMNDLHCKHSKELEKIRCRINNFQSQLSALKTDYEKVKCSNNHQLTDFRKCIQNYKNSFNELSQTFKTQLKDQENAIRCKEIELETMQQKIKNMQHEHSEETTKLTNKHNAEVQEIEYEMLKTISDLQKALEKEKRECTAKINRIQTEKQLEIEALTRRYEKEKHVLQTQSETKIKQMEEDFEEANILAEIQTKQQIEEVEVCYKMKLEAQQKESEQILKECQAISEYNIIQCEVEKNHIKMELSEEKKKCEDLLVEINDLSVQYAELQDQFSALREQFDDLVKELGETKRQLEENNKCEEKNLYDERAYEITIKQLHGTIEALKKRLLSSDRDVEQLKSELSFCEKSKLTVEDKCNKLQEELQQLQNLNEELEMQNESSLKLTEEKIQAIERVLHEEVEDYKIIAEITTKQLEGKLQDKEEKFVEVMEQLHVQQQTTSACYNLINTTKLELERLEAANAESENKNIRLEMVLKQLEEDMAVLKINEMNAKEKLLQTEKAMQNEVSEKEKLKQELDMLKNIREENEAYKKQIVQLQKKNEEDVKLRDFYKNKLNEYETEIEESSCLRRRYIEQSGKYDELLHRFEQLARQNTDLEVKIFEQESLIGPFREQLKAYEMEHKALINEKHDAENEAKEMGLKYATILGHQNQKQKIKYLVDLQTKKFELIENKKELESKVRAQSRLIEKLKKEIANITKTKKSSSKSGNKENLNSPNKALNISHSESPGGPLKERN